MAKSFILDIRSIIQSRLYHLSVDFIFSFFFNFFKSSFLTSDAVYIRQIGTREISTLRWGSFPISPGWKHEYFFPCSWTGCLARRLNIFQSSNCNIQASAQYILYNKKKNIKIKKQQLISRLHMYIYTRSRFFFFFSFLLFTIVYFFSFLFYFFVIRNFAARATNIMIKIFEQPGPQTYDL